MESTIYQESPLANYLEGQGEASHQWQQIEHCDDRPNSSHKPSFAPKTSSSLRLSQLRNFLSPLQSKRRGRAKTLTALRDVCSTATGVRVSADENNRFVDRFRYLIIASQLLANETSCQADTDSSTALREKDAWQNSEHDRFSIQGGAVALAMSFFCACTIYAVKARSSQTLVSIREFTFATILVAAVAVGIYGYARRKALQLVRHQAMDALSNLLDHYRRFDSRARATLSLIQEIEVVSRGYDISSPLPPISRLEMRGTDRRCFTLRSGVANTMSTVFDRHIVAHHAVLPFADALDMHRYHDIYELSRKEYQHIFQVPDDVEEDPESLRGLRSSLTRYFTARQILLCDLLALPSKSTTSDFSRWSVLSDEVTSLASAIEASATALDNLIGGGDISDGERRTKTGALGQYPSSSTRCLVVTPPRSPGRGINFAQQNRLDALSRSIRGVNARVMIMREETSGLANGSKETSDKSSVLANNYEMIGTELRSLLSEWERGRNAMLFRTGPLDQSSRSRPSSILRSPQSPVHSLGGQTEVNEGSPDDAFRRLAGSDSQNNSIDAPGSEEEETFEAVSLPPRPKRLSLTREVKMAKMQEDRRKRATLQESRDATTSMLRELETVIKHRPRGRTTTSRITTL